MPASNKKFKTFRALFLGFIGFVSSACIALVIYLHPYLTHRDDIWTLIFIPGTAVLAVTWSVLRKPCFKSPQLVAYEATGAFSLLPFEIILVLVVLSATPKERSGMHAIIFAVLQILIIINAGLFFFYTTFLLLTVMLTRYAFDTNVWHRDIDSSPSPFPMSILLAYAFPFLSTTGSLSPTPELDHPTPNPEVTQCLPGCNCTVKPLIAPEMSQRLSSDLFGKDEGENRKQNMTGSGSLSRSLVRIPNAVERRSSIMIAFEV